jgi:hypothetical protein
MIDRFCCIGQSCILLGGDDYYPMRQEEGKKALFELAPRSMIELIP